MGRNFLPLIFLWVAAFAGFSFADPLQESEKVLVSDSESVELDSVAIYTRLIEEESPRKSYIGNRVLMIVGGSMMGMGTLSLLAGSIMLNSASDLDDLLQVYFGGALFLSSIPLLGAGIPIFVINTCLYVSHKKRSERLDAYQDALRRYKERKANTDSGSVEWMIVPSVDVANAGGGLNLFVAF
jgi:hypothetical protein